MERKQTNDFLWFFPKVSSKQGSKSMMDLYLPGIETNPLVSTENNKSGTSKK